MANFNQIVKYLKKNDRNLYNQYKDCIASPVVLVNRLIRHYQWMLEIRDFSKLDLHDRQNKNYLNLFLYAMEKDAELANNFINYFTFLLKNAFDYKTRKWNIDLVFNIMIHQSSSNEFDIIAMYILMAATFDRFINFFKNFEVKDKLSISADEVFELFLLIVNQRFYNDLKREVANKRKKSLYFKKSNIDINVPFSSDEDLEIAKKVELLKQAQEIAEEEFAQWDDQQQIKNNEIKSEQQQESTSQEEDSVQDIKQETENKVEKLEEKTKEIPIVKKFVPNPNIKIIKIKR